MNTDSLLFIFFLPLITNFVRNGTIIKRYRVCNQGVKAVGSICGVRKHANVFVGKV